jgi:hypothetical protein
MSSVTNIGKVTIANGATESGYIETSSNQPIAIHLPAAFTGTAITFKVASTFDGTYKAVTDKAGAALALVVAADKVVQILPVDGVVLTPFLKLVAAAQGQETIIEVITYGL